MDQEKNHLEAYFRDHRQGRVSCSFFKYMLKVATSADRQRVRWKLNTQQVERAEGKCCNIKNCQKGLSHKKGQVTHRSFSLLNLPL